MKVRSIICSFVFDDHRRIFEEIELKEDNRKDITSALKNDVHLSSLSQWMHTDHYQIIMRNLSNDV